MVGRTSLAAIAASALLFSGGGLAYADDSLPGSDTSLVEVYVNSESDIDALVAEGFDLAEYKRVEADGEILVNIDADAGERAQLRAKGFRIGATIESPEHRAAVAAERDAQREADLIAADYAENGVPKSKGAVALPGETVIQRANKFTNYAGTFLYVEAHNKASGISGTATKFGPSQALSFAGADGVYSTPVTMARFDDTDPTPDVYMYHRQLIRLTPEQAAIPASDLTVRVASSSGAVDTFKVTEWLGASLPGHAQGYLQGFFSRYQDPTENRAQLDRLASEFPNLVTPVNLPNLSVGYQRKAQTILGAWVAPATGQAIAPYAGATGNLTTAESPKAVILTSNAWGHEGGNNISARIVAPTAADAPLAVNVGGNAITVSLGTDSSGAAVSTAAQVVAAINANEAAAALVTASTYRGNAGTAVPRAGDALTLKDYLNAPSHVQKGQFQQRVYRIGSVRDGSKVGVFLYCQQHAREWTTGLSCVETAERLVRNYGTDPETKKLLDDVEVFVLANANPDGAHYSMYDFNSQRRNMSNHCAPNTFQDPMARNSWGVDLNRNNGEFSRLDGYFGADASCTSDVYSGPEEYSEPEIKNEKWIVDTFPNIKFANNVHSYGGYFMWAPGSYKNDGQRTTAPAPNIGIEKYFFEAGEKILGRIKEYRNTVILPERTGPIADVLYSASGNSADDQWYRKGVISYSFETGADKFVSTSTGTQQIITGFQPCFAGAGTHGGTNTSSAQRCDTQPLLVNEGRDQAMEFASGNFGMVESAYDYAKDTTAPVVSLDSDGVTKSKDPINFRFNWDTEAAVIYYTTDGSEPNLSSPKYTNQRARSIGEVLTLSTPGTHTVKWLAVDIKGNQAAVKSQTFVVDVTAPTITLTRPVDGAVYTQDQPVTAAFACADEGGSELASCTGTVANGAAVPTAVPGYHEFTVTAKDGAGNTTVQTVTYRVLDAVNTPGGIGGNVPATLSLTLGAPATFGQFLPGVAREYTATTTANVISTAGDATLSVADPTNDGHLVNGAFKLAQPLQGLGQLKTWAAPVSNDLVPVTLKQSIGANQPLRTGAYSTTLVFTLSTTTP